MRNSENSSTRSKLAAVTRIGLLVLIFAVVFATVLSCGAFGESATLNNGSVENVAEAGGGGKTSQISISGLSYTMVGYDSSSTKLGESKISLGGLYSAYNALRIANTKNLASTTLAASLDSVQFSFDSNVSAYNSNKGVSGYINGAGTFGAYSGSQIGAGTFVAVNLAVPTEIANLISAGYGVSVSWKVTKYNTWDIGDQELKFLVVAGSNVRSATDLKDASNWTAYGIDASSEKWTDKEFSPSSVALNSSTSVITLAFLRTAGGSWISREWGAAVGGMTLTFTITKGTATDGTGPSFTNVDVEGDGFNGLTIPAGESQVGSAYTNNRGTSDPSASSGNYKLGMVTGSIAGTEGGVSYYKSMSMDISDGSATSAAFYHGIKSAKLSMGGVSATAAASASSGGSANASNGLFRVEIDKITDWGTKSAVRVYFAANGTYTLSLYDNGSAFGVNEDNHTDITIEVSGIDFTAPSGLDIGGSAPGNGTADLEQLASAPWNTAGVATAAINGKPYSDTGSAWVYYFDVRYSFFAFTGAPSASTEDLGTRSAPKSLTISPMPSRSAERKLSASRAITRL